jgi:hypothetical protein
MIDYIKLARQANLGTALVHNSIEGERIFIEGADWHDEIERFAELVQEAERERWARQLDALGCDHCAAAIRARKPNTGDQR